MSSTAATLEQASVSEPERMVGSLEVSGERPRLDPASASNAAARGLDAIDGCEAIEAIESQTGGAEEGHSDVFVCRRSSPELPAVTPEAIAAAKAAAEGVTLFVYGWENVQPGPLSWVFPSLRAALDAVRTMRNAVQWCIVAGNEWASIDLARERGAVLIEQTT